MKLVKTEILLDRSKALFYFTSDKRIDFRELVRELAAEFRMRIEMRQIGVRDEAKWCVASGVAEGSSVAPNS
jgi:cell fate regulator YaaT (PSP1 superfamily)